jgi:hypothetical protein
MKRSIVFFLVLMALVATNAFATPTLVFNVDFYTNGINPVNNYASQVLDTGQTIILKPGEIVWATVYVSGLNEQGNGLTGFDGIFSWTASQLAYVAPATPGPVSPWADYFSGSNGGPGYVDIQGMAPIGTGITGDMIPLANFELMCTAGGLSPLTLNSLGEGWWITLTGEDLGGQVSNVALGNINNNVPIPAAVWLFGSGLLGLFGIRRKIKA